MHEYSASIARRISHKAMRSNGPGPPMAWVTNADAAGVPVRILVPSERARGVVVWFHPGCWVFGSPADTETVARKLAERTSSVWVLPGYRLAPEHPYPAAIDDSQTALDWVAEHREELSATGTLIVGGEGAGATLAATAARRSRDRGSPAVALQILICPFTDAGSLDSLLPDRGEGLLFTAETVRWALDHYVPEPETRLEADVSPLRAAHLASLPPALIVTAEHDPLRDQGAAYAERLRDAGVPVRLQSYARQMHGFFSLMELRLGERVFQDVVRGVRACVDRATTAGEAVAAGARTREGGSA